MYEYTTIPKSDLFMFICVLHIFVIIQWHDYEGFSARGKNNLFFIVIEDIFAENNDLAYLRKRLK